MSREAASETLTALDGRTERDGRRTGFLVAIGLLAGVSLLSVFLAALFGAFPIPVRGVLAVIGSALGWSGEASLDPTWKVIVLDIRLSRICLSWGVGAALSVAGAVFQGILRNPLADPFTLGVSTGAAFGASLAIYLGLGGLVLVTGLDLLPLAALAGALAALAAVILLSRVGGYLRRETLVLAGIVVATFLAALISLLKALDEESVSNIVFWIMGSFQGRGWSHVVLFIPYLAVGFLIIWRYSRELDILSLGEVQARQLGMDAGRVRLVLLIGASLITGAAVSVSGVIGFVGLVVPHLVRMVQGAEHRPLLITSGLLGGFLLLWSDVMARTILPGGAELPVGVVTALLGGPFFCLLLRRKAAEDVR
ncbi:MAG: iron ABC transporter permease [Proteobacteria bacterium]|nr:iron ABC transporter permease [Pseudomonadota bacterium]